LETDVASQITVDYTRPEAEVFRDVALLMYQRYAELFLRGTITLISFESPTASNMCPSWVPNLANRRSSRDRRSRSSLGIISGDTHKWTLRSPQLEIFSNYNLIRFRGLRLDAISETLEFGRVDKSVWLRGLDPKVLRQAEQLATSARSHPIPQSHPMSDLQGLRDKEELLTILTVIKHHPGLAHTSKVERATFWDILTERVTEDQVLRSSAQNQHQYWRLMIQYFWDSVYRRLDGRKLIISEAGFVGVGVPDVEKGDVIAFIFGTPCPIILRPVMSSTGYNFVGFAYVSGFMDVEEVERYDKEGRFNGLDLETTFDIY
jgi:hypothetical protein